MKFGAPSSSSSSDSDSPRPQPQRPTRPVPTRKHSRTTPFTPKPVRVVHPPKLKAKRGRLVPLSSGSSSSDGGGGGSSEEDSEEEEEEDSEEEEWPVGPIGSVGIGGWRRTSKGKGRAFNQNGTEGSRLYGGPDELELWDEKERASSWATANRSFHLSLSRSLSSSPPPLDSRSSDVSSIQSLLATLALAQTQSQAALVTSFESRNTALWSSIEASILQAEKEEGEKQRMMEENRKRGEEAERKAKEMREAETKRVQEEAKKKVEGQKEEERKRKEQRIAQEGEKAKAAAGAAAAATAGVATSSTDEGSPKAEWERWTAKMLHIKNSVLPAVSQNPVYRKACFTAKRAITPKIGQLTSSVSATTTIIAQLDSLLTSLRPPAGQETAIEPYIWTLNHLAKALVKQAEQEVTAKLGTAYPLGRVVVGLLARGHTDLGDVLMARLIKKCFWITGYWPPKRPDETDLAHQKSLGHAPPSTAESLTQYASRQAGLIALYAAIVQTSPLTPPQGPCPPSALANIPPHFGPVAGWRWLVLILRPPLVGLEPTPLLLVTFLEIAGEALLEVFGRQMGKFLEVLLREGIREGKAGFLEKARSSLVRLQLWLEDWEQKGRVEGEKGRVGDP